MVYMWSNSLSACPNPHKTNNRNAHHPAPLHFAQAENLADQSVKAHFALSVVQDPMQNADDASLVSAVSALSQNPDLNVITEVVEAEMQRDGLRKLNPGPTSAGPNR